MTERPARLVWFAADAAVQASGPEYLVRIVSQGKPGRGSPTSLRTRLKPVAVQIRTG